MYVLFGVLTVSVFIVYILYSYRRCHRTINGVKRQYGLRER